MKIDFYDYVAIIAFILLSFLIGFFIAHQTNILIQKINFCEENHYNNGYFDFFNQKQSFCYKIENGEFIAKQLKCIKEKCYFIK